MDDISEMLSEVEDLEVLDGNKLSFMEKFWGNSPEVRSTEENKSRIFVKQSTEDVNESIEEKLSEGEAKSGMESNKEELLRYCDTLVVHSTN